MTTTRYFEVKVTDSAIPLTHDGSTPNQLRERCCMCREFTPYWHAPTDVALCPSCANTTQLSELPSKREWCEKERKLTNSPMWNETKESETK